MLPSNLAPVGDRILVEVSEKGEVRFGSIIAPTSAVENENDLTGRALAVGPGEKNKNGVLVETTVKVNDTILFAKSAASQVKINGDTFYVVRERDIYGILN